MRRVAVVSVARSDYNIYRPLLKAIQTHPRLSLHVVAGGMHVSERHGMTVTEIERDGFPIAERVEFLEASDTREAIARSTGRAVSGFAAALSRIRPDIVVLIGDRFEMLSAAVAALLLGLPIAHLHGGEASFGAVDESIRHAISKMAHLHFVTAEPYAERLRQMGESAWRIAISGAPALDAIAGLSRPDAAQFERDFGVRLDPPPLLVTYHPVTLEIDALPAQLDALFASLQQAGRPVIFTAPNADAGNQLIAERIDRFVRAHADAWLVANFGARYFDALRLSAAMVGNSSSGVIEAASFELPVVNIGSRQDGRIRARNVIDVPCETAAIVGAIGRATAPSFRASLRGLTNPYGAGQASERIVERLANVELNDQLLRKVFQDLTLVAS